MAEISLDELRRRACVVTSKPLSDVTLDDLRVVDEYLRHENLGISQEMLDFINTPEQQAVTQNLLKRVLS